MVTSAQQAVMWYAVSMPRAGNSSQAVDPPRSIDFPSQTPDLLTQRNINTHRESQALEPQQLSNRDIAIPIQAPELQNQASIANRIYRVCVRASFRLDLDTRWRQFTCCTTTACLFLIGGALGSLLSWHLYNSCNSYEPIN